MRNGDKSKCWCMENTIKLKKITMKGNRWLFFILGWLLIIGVYSYTLLSSIWHPTSYRLPKTTLPRHYELTITPYFEEAPRNIAPFTFDGEVVIYLRPTIENVDSVVIHCNYLIIESLSIEYRIKNTTRLVSEPGQTYMCENVYHFLKITTTEVLHLNQEYILRGKYKGFLRRNVWNGFYRTQYNDSSGRRWMASTLFQPIQARMVFPCYDEPSFKATFDMTVNRELTFSPTISNMPIKNSTILANGRISETFYTTPLMSTYSLAFVISNYEVMSTNNNKNKAFKMYARDNAGRTGDWAIEIGQLILEAMEKYTDISYYTMAKNMNMKLAAIAGFSAAGMENWGLMTFKESKVLYDPQNSNYCYKGYAAKVVSHEIIHMWFGNLVTCAWWDNIWLNEGFAIYLSYHLTALVAPDLGTKTRFIVEQVHVGLFHDSVDSVHALTDVSANIDPVSTSASFTFIAYAKGAAILKMTQHLLGEDTFVKGIRSYLNDRKYDVVEPYHLFRFLDTAALEDRALDNYDGISINEYFKTWSEKAGHPLLTVKVNHTTGEITVLQTRWERNTGVSQFSSLWHIPITWTRAKAPEFEDLKPSQIITQQSTFIDRNTTGYEWVIFNKQVSGFYRINYDNVTWTLITRYLRGSNRTIIHEYNRAQIVDDVFALARANVMSYNKALNILSFLEFEDAYAPWIAAIDGFNFLIEGAAHDATILLKLQKLIIQLSMAITARLGFRDKPEEPFMDSLLRMYVMQFLCNHSHQKCVEAGKRNFQRWRKGEFLPANMRPWVYCVGLREGTAADFDYFWNRYLREDLANEIVVMLQTVGCTSDQTSLERFLNATMASDDIIRPQDLKTAFNAVITGNIINAQKVFEWLQNYGSQFQFRNVHSLLSNIASRLLTEKQLKEFELWVTNNRNSIGEFAYNNVISGAQNTRSNLKWFQERLLEVSFYLKTNYVEDKLEDLG